MLLARACSTHWTTCARPNRRGQRPRLATHLHAAPHKRPRPVTAGFVASVPPRGAAAGAGGGGRALAAARGGGLQVLLPPGGKGQPPVSRNLLGSLPEHPGADQDGVPEREGRPGERRREGATHCGPGILHPVGQVPRSLEPGDGGLRETKGGQR